MKKVDLKENQVYCLKTTITVPIDGPPAFRSFTIGLKLPGEPTGKELNTFDKQLRAHKDYETALDNPTEMMKLTAEVHPKMKPLTPYEVEIIGHYTQLHIDIANTMQLRKDVLAQIPGLQDKFKQVHEVIPKIIKEFDNLLRDARIVQHP